MQVVSTIHGLMSRISDGSYEIMGGVLDPDTFFISLLALLLRVSVHGCGLVCIDRCGFGCV